MLVPSCCRPRSGRVMGGVPRRAGARRRDPRDTPIVPPFGTQCHSRRRDQPVIHGMPLADVEHWLGRRTPDRAPKCPAQGAPAGAGQFTDCTHAIHRHCRGEVGALVHSACAPRIDNTAATALHGRDERPLRHGPGLHDTRSVAMIRRTRVLSLRHRQRHRHRLVPCLRDARLATAQGSRRVIRLTFRRKGRQRAAAGHTSGAEGAP